MTTLSYTLLLFTVQFNTTIHILCSKAAILNKKIIIIILAMAAIILDLLDPVGLILSRQTQVQLLAALLFLFYCFSLP